MIMPPVIFSFESNLKYFFPPKVQIIISHDTIYEAYEVSEIMINDINNYKRLIFTEIKLKSFRSRLTHPFILS